MRWRLLPEFEDPPTNWSIRPFGAVAQVIAGQSPPSDLYNDRGEGLPFLQGNADFGDVFPVAAVWCAAPRKVAPRGASLISVRAPVGEINRADCDYGIGRGLAAVIPTDIDADLLHHGLFRWSLPLRRVGQGSTFEAVTSRHFKQLLVLVPNDRDEQERIGRILSVATQAVTAARNELAAALRAKEALLRELFTHGLPRKHRRFRVTKIGELPEAWEVTSLGTIAEIESGVTLNQDRAPRRNAYQYLTVINVQRGEIVIDEPRFIELAPSEVPRKLLRQGDILVVEGHANSGEIGRAAMTGAEHDSMSYQNHLFRIRRDDAVINREFLLHALNAEYAQRHWSAVCNTSSGLNTINRRQLRRLPIPRPERPEQESIVSLIQAANEAIEAISHKVMALDRVKRSMLETMLTGKVRVRR